MRKNLFKTLLNEYGLNPGAATPVGDQARVPSKNSQVQQPPAAKPNAVKPPSPVVTKQANKAKSQELSVGDTVIDPTTRQPVAVHDIVGNPNKPETVVVQDPRTKKLTALQPNDEVELMDDIVDDVLDDHGKIANMVGKQKDKVRSIAATTIDEALVAFETKTLSEQLDLVSHLDHDALLDHHNHLLSSAIPIPFNEGAVPDNDKVRRLKQVLASPLRGDDYNGQMQAFFAIPDPKMIKEFRAAIAVQGPSGDLRSVVKHYVDNQLHPQVKNQLGESVINEKTLGKADIYTDDRKAAFYNKIRANQPFIIADNQGEIYLDAMVADAYDETGEFPAKLTTSDGSIIPWNRLEKTADFGGRSGGAVRAAGAKAAQGGEKVGNKGELAEGLLGAATFARLLKRPSKPITEKDVFTVIKRLPKGTPKDDVVSLSLTAKEVHNDITDKFTLNIQLKPDTYADLVDPSKWPQMSNITRGVVDYVNSNLRMYSALFEKNGKPDEVRVVADGVTGENDTKVDVFLVYKDVSSGEERVLTHYDMSVKAGSTKQMGQVGGGKQSLSMVERFNILVTMWERFGVDISNVKNKFVNATSVEEGYTIAYEAAAKKLKKELKGVKKDPEMKYFQTLIKAIKHFATLNDDRVKLVQFADTKSGSFYVLDFKKLDRLYDMDKMDLDVEYDVGKSSSGTPIPKVKFINKKTGEPLLTVRMYRTSKGYIRNYIDKEKGLVGLTKVRGRK